MRSGTPTAVKAQSDAIVEAVLGGVNVLQTAGHVHDGAADEVCAPRLYLFNGGSVVNSIR